MTAARSLVVGPAWVGDMVMAQSLFKAMPGPVDVLAPAWTLPLLERMPEVDQAIVMPIGHGRLGLLSRYRLGRSLRGRYDRAVVLPNSYKSALVPFWARVPCRTGYVGECRYGVLTDARTLDKEALPMTVQRFVALAHDRNAPLPHRVSPPLLRADAAAERRTAEQHGLTLDRPALALCPGAEYGPAKRWPAGHFARLADLCQRAGWQTWVLGSDNDRAFGCDIEAMVGNGCHDFTGRTTLSEAIDLLSSADAVVSNDSGLMHVAAALRRPLVALYGSSDPRITPPLEPTARVLRLGLDCSPCMQRTCPLTHTRCLQDLRPEMVLAALAEFGLPGLGASAGRKDSMTTGCS